PRRWAKLGYAHEENRARVVCPVACGLPDRAALPAIPVVVAAATAALTSSASLPADHAPVGHSAGHVAALWAKAGAPHLQQTHRPVRGVEHGPLHGCDGARSAPHPPWRAGGTARRRAAAELQERRDLRQERCALHLWPQYVAGAGGGAAPLRSHGGPGRRLH